MKGLSCVTFTYCVSHDHSAVTSGWPAYAAVARARALPFTAPWTRDTCSFACGAGKNVTATLQSSPDGTAIRSLCVSVQRSTDGRRGDRVCVGGGALLLPLSYVVQSVNGPVLFF